MSDIAEAVSKVRVLRQDRRCKAAMRASGPWLITVGTSALLLLFAIALCFPNDKRNPALGAAVLSYWILFVVTVVSRIWWAAGVRAGFDYASRASSS